jgi:hypothetical protein
LTAAVNSQEGELRYLTELDYITGGRVVSSASSVAKKVVDPVNSAVTGSEVQPKVRDPKVLNGHDKTATHLLLSGIAVPIEYAQIGLSNAHLAMQAGTATNLQELLSGRKLFIVNDVDRNDVQTGDRLGSELADGVITVIKVIEGDSV